MKIILIVISVLTFALTFLPTYSYAASHNGRISYYSSGSHTSSGERFNKRAFTCAHRTLPFGTIVKVGYRGKVVACRVNDRGPFVRGRVLDVSLASAHALGMTGAGVVYATLVW
jgi:rare lipoprotein A